MGRRICFRADASAEIGYGHFIRSLALANMLKDDFECVFYTQSPTDYQRNEAEKVCELVALPADNSRFALFLDYLKGDEIVVLDNYFFTTDYQRQIKAKGCKLVCIDDMHDRHYVADMVINHVLTNKSLFDCEIYTKLCLGLEYALLREPFLTPIPNQLRNNDIVINFGGADPFGITDSVVTMFLELKLSYHLIVILGDKVHLSDKNRKRVEIRKNLSAKQMATLFENSKAGIFSASTVCIEALSRNLPLIVGYHVNNQKEFYHILVDKKLAQPLGFLQETNKESLFKAIQFINQLEKYNFPTNIKNRFIQSFKMVLK